MNHHEASNWLPVFTKNSSSTTGSVFSQLSFLDQTVIPSTSSGDVDASSLRSDLATRLAKTEKDMPTANERKLQAAQAELAYRWASASFTMNRQAVGLASDSSPPIDAKATRERYDKASRILKNEEDKPIAEVLKEYEAFLLSVMAEREQEGI